MKEWYITFTKDNLPKIKNGTKTMTRRVIEKIDQYKNIQPGDILVIRKNRFSKVEIDRYEVIITWIEKVQDITEQDAFKEGVSNTLNGNPDPHDIMEFEKLWDSINVKRGYSWNSNPRVRVIEWK